MNEAMRVALVTGGDRGMGREICRQLAEHCMKVLLTSRDEAQGREAAEALAAAGLDVAHRTLDVTDPASVHALRTFLEEEHGRLDVLVNNAGLPFDSPAMEGQTASFFDVDPQVVRRSFELNIMGALHCCRELIPLMQANDHGRVVNVSSSMAAFDTMGAGWPGYRISKVGLNALTRLLSAELEGSSVKVNAVCPEEIRKDLEGAEADEALAEGVDTIIWLATLRDDGPSGGFFRDCKAIPW